MWIIKARAASIGVVLFLAMRPGFAAEPFDGTWAVQIDCAAAARGAAQSYQLHFLVNVADGHLHGEGGAPGRPAYTSLDGRIKPSGAAALDVHGLTNHPEKTMGQVNAGTPYRYRVAATFTPTQATDSRTTGGRECSLSFFRPTP